MQLTPWLVGGETQPLRLKKKNYVTAIREVFMQKLESELGLE